MVQTKKNRIAFVNGHILTLQPDQPIANSILIDGDRILGLGMAEDHQEVLGSSREIIDLDGKTVVPGFIDTHTHLIGTGMAHFMIDLTDVFSLDEALARLQDGAANAAPGSWVIGYGLAAGLSDKRRLPTRRELDRISTTSPIFLGERTGHACALNTAGLAELTLPEALQGMELEADGSPIGILSSTANTIASEQTDLLFARQLGYAKIIAAAAEQALAAGLTTLHALDGAQPTDDPGVRALLDHGEDGSPRILVYYQTRTVSGAVDLGLPRIGGCGACWVDGAFTPHTAALLEPYAEDPSTSGTLYFPDEALYEFFRDAHTAGLQISVHCVGDGAVEQALRTYEQVLHEDPRPDHRHRIEHAELITPGQIQRARQLGIAFAIQPAFNYFWRHDEFYVRVLGFERSLRVDPVRSLVDGGLTVAGGSDSTVTPLRPLLGIHSAVNHSNPSERLDPLTAIGLFTKNAAWIGFEEESKGTLRPGKLADLVILGENPLAVPPAEIKDIPVAMTVIGGEVLVW